MRKQFNAKLDTLRDQMDQTEALCLEMLDCSQKWLQSDDRTNLYDTLQVMHSQVHHLTSQIDHECLQLLLREQPVARDLRYINLSNRLSMDLMRIAALSLDFAGYCMKKDVSPLKDSLSEMIIQTKTILIASFRACREFSSVQASRIDHMDDKVDDAFEQMKQLVTVSEKSHAISRDEAINILMAAKSLERIADHAVRMAASLQELAD